MILSSSQSLVTRVFSLPHYHNLGRAETPYHSLYDTKGGHRSCFSLTHSNDWWQCQSRVHDPASDILQSVTLGSRITWCVSIDKPTSCNTDNSSTPSPQPLLLINLLQCMFHYFFLQPLLVTLAVSLGSGGWWNDSWWGLGRWWARRKKEKMGKERVERDPWTLWERGWCPHADAITFTHSSILFFLPGLKLVFQTRVCTCFPASCKQEEGTAVGAEQGDGIEIRSKHMRAREKEPSNLHHHLRGHVILVSLINMYPLVFGLREQRKGWALKIHSLHQAGLVLASQAHMHTRQNDCLIKIQEKKE